MAQPTGAVDEDLKVLDVKLKRLKNEYDQYFLGSRPREPSLLRGEVQKLVSYYSNVPIQNTALRFKFNNLCARFFALRRHWDATVRQIQEGTYARHVFKAHLREREKAEAAPEKPARRATRGGAAGTPQEDLFEAYRAAQEKCGQDVSTLTRAHLEKIVARQEKEIRRRTGCEEVRFRVAVEKGRARLKATPVRREKSSGM